MSEQEHTKGQAVTTGGYYPELKIGDHTIAAVEAPPDESGGYNLAEANANARRLAACWNACEGLGVSTESLESGALTEMLAALRDLAECSQCTNGCDPNDMTCATNAARAAIAKATDAD